jgi:hypothetical protein
MNPSSRHLAPLFILSALLLTLAPSQAAALDGYQDREGLMGGLTIGGGLGFVEVEPEDGMGAASSGIDRGRKLGFHLSGQIGGGVSESLVFLGEVNWWARTVQIGPNQLEHHHMSALGLANFFLFDALYLEAGGGLAYGIFNAARNNMLLNTTQELGMAARAGLGFEFFVNSDVAIGMRMGYTRHFYTNGSFDVVNANFTLRFY